MKEITAKQLKELYNTSMHNVKVIDIRQEWEIEEEGKIPLSINIEMDEVVVSNQWKDQHEFIIFYCNSGRRSASLNLHLTKFYNTTNTYSLIGGIQEWKKLHDYNSQDNINLLG